MENDIIDKKLRTTVYGVSPRQFILLDLKPNQEGLVLCLKNPMIRFTPQIAWVTTNHQLNNILEALDVKH